MIKILWCPIDYGRCLLTHSYQRKYSLNTSIRVRVSNTTNTPLKSKEKQSLFPSTLFIFEIWYDIVSIRYSTETLSYSLRIASFSLSVGSSSSLRNLSSTNYSYKRSILWLSDWRLLVYRLINYSTSDQTFLRSK